LAAAAAFPSTSVGRIAEVRLGKMLQPKPNVPTDSEVHYLRAGSLEGLTGDGALKKMWASPAERANYSVRRGDLIVAEGGDVGHSAFVPEVPNDTIIQNSLHRIRPRSGDIRFLKYALDTVYASGWLDVLCNKATFGHLTREKLSALSIPWPSDNQQRAIADFLDAETARIDALIEKKRRLKQVLATRLATLARSLVFDQPDTTKVRLGRVVSILPGYSFSSPDFRMDEENAIRLLRGINVAPGRCRWEEVAYLPRRQAHQHQTYMLSPGDLVLGMDRPFINGGTRLATIKETDVPSLLVQRVARIRAKEALNPKYLSFALHSDLFKDHCTPITTGVSVPHISADQIADFHMPLPARNVQNVIAERLTNEGTRTDVLRSQISRQIELLTEHRQALITAAVTGQVDVPGAFVRDSPPH
jgi:type I restriction enzyme S subunit